MLQEATKSAPAGTGFTLVLCGWSPLRGFAFVHHTTHGWRRGLYSCAASRLFADH